MSRHEPDDPTAPDPLWWKGAVFYQIYPRSFKDSNGDGVGDLRGITEELEYVASLGVDGIWLSPFFLSPMRDFGYDVADYRAVDPVFGTLADFDSLLDKAHGLGLKLVIDQVLSHTSDQHSWFQESRRDRTNPKADWYVWAEPRPDGTPPTNWQSVFGGSAWDFDMARGQYYFHNFLKEQPDLNLHNPDVQKALLACAQFWLERGVDGFRLDVINFYFHDKGLRDNPASPDPVPGNFNVTFPTPFTMQIHKYNKNQLEVFGFIEKMRGLLDRYGATMAVGEVADERGAEIGAAYTRGTGRLHTCYNFDLLSGTCPSARRIRESVMRFENHSGGESWPSWAFSNHDVVRVATRWCQPEDKPEDTTRRACAFIALLCSLRGTIFLYQGEELGLPESTLPYDKIQDPWGKYLWPRWQGRDGCRTPFPWTAGENGGFTTGTPWLPCDSAHRPLCVSAQDPDPYSTLAFTRAFLHWRKMIVPLRTGTISFEETDADSVCVFYRTQNSQKILCLFNLSAREHSVQIPPDSVLLETPAPHAPCRINDREDSARTVTLPPYGFCFVSVP